MVSFEEFVEQAGDGIKVELMPSPRQTIRWVASTELTEPEEFLEGGELVLTTGLFAKKWKKTKWNDYVRRLSDRGCAGLGFGEGLSFPKVPEALVEACQTWKINLISVERQVPFIQISQLIAELKSKTEEEPFAHSFDDNSGLMIQQQLTRAATKGDFESLLQSLASILRTQVAWHSETGSLVEGPFGEGLVAYPQSEFQQAIAAGPGLASNDVEGRRIIPIGRNSQGAGYLCIDVIDAATSWQLSALGLTVSLMGIITDTQYQRRMMSLQVRSVISRLLLDRQLEGAQLLAKEFNLALAPQMQVATCRIASDGLALRQLQSLENRFSGSTFWLADEDGQGRRTLTLISDQVQDNLQQIASTRLWGIGSMVDLKAIHLSYEQSQWALTKAIRMGTTQEWQEKKTPQLWELISAEDGQSFVDQQLGPIKEDPQAIETLAAYLLGGGSIAATAQELVIHRNSVIYRLQRLQKTLQVDLNDPSVRANLWSALQILSAGLERQ